MMTSFLWRIWHWKNCQFFACSLVCASNCPQQISDSNSSWQFQSIQLKCEIRYCHNKKLLYSIQYAYVHQETPKDTPSDDMVSPVAFILTTCTPNASSNNDTCIQVWDFFDWNKPKDFFYTVGGNWTHNLHKSSVMLYQLRYKALGSQYG